MKGENESGVFGELGEDIAARYLEGKGYKIVSRNFRKPWGEIDIVAKSCGVMYFFEVKTIISVSSRWEADSVHRRPEERVSRDKLARLRRAVETFLLESGIEDKVWQFAVVGVYLDPESKKARVGVTVEPL